MSLELVCFSYTFLWNRYLLTNQRRTVIDLMPMIGARFYTQIDNIQSRTDVLENELSKEMENTRLFRLMVKLDSINERPEYIVAIVNYSFVGLRLCLFCF